MIVKNLNHTLIGTNYLSVLLSIELVERKNNVLLLDDKRIQLGDFFCSYLTLLDKSFLKEWGEDKDLLPLKNIDNYLKTQNLYFIAGGKRLLLGRSPFQNAQELFRKFPELFGQQSTEILNTISIDKDKFNETFELYVSRLGFELFRFNSIGRVDVNTFLEKAPSEITKMFNLLENHISDFIESETGKVLFFNLRSHFQKSLNYQTSRIELLFLFISMLCPNYKLSNDILVDELINILKLRGGYFKSSQIKEWFFYKGKPWSMELSSYEGVIHPQKLVFLGGFPQSMPLKWDPVPETYSAVHSQIELDKSLGDGLYIMSDHNDIGKDNPICLFRVNKTKIDCWCLVLRRKGSKVEFIDSHIRSHFNNKLQECFPGIEVSLTNQKIEFVSDIWVNLPTKQKNISKTEALKLKKMRVVDSSSPGKELSLKNTYYYGPLKEGPLGLLTSLLDIKDSNQYL